ncbi:MAG: MarR family transcriptional regulator [Actinomycetota bacterium]|nr:MarR family transcriptional regulator [Actinomycetota bacterium]
MGGPEGGEHVAVPDPADDAPIAFLDGTASVPLSRAQGVTLPQFRMLVVLSEAATNLSTLAAALDVAPSTARRMVDRLEAAGLVERSVHPDNRRETHLSMTAAGRRIVRTVTTRRRRDLTTVLSQLSLRERAALAHAMTAFARAADTLWPGETDTIS